MLRLTLYGAFSLTGADGAEIPLKSQKAKALLAYLALSPGKTRSREEIMALLWSDRGEDQARASLRQVLFGLRKALGGDPLKAVRITDEAVSLDPGQVIVKEADVSDELLAGFHLHDPAFEDWLRDERLRMDDGITPMRQSVVPVLADKPSIAVLPFTNMSGDPEQAYFVDGITEDIITELSRFRSLFVIASNSSFHYLGTSLKAQDVGRELGVAYIVVGSVRKVGKRVRVTAQLVESESGNHIWAERYDHDLEDIFAVQDELTRTVVSTIAGRIEIVGHGRARGMSADSLQAYDLVLRARRHTYAFKKLDNAEAKKLLERAIALDPANARTHAALANCHHLDWFSHWAAAGDASLAEAYRLAKMAVELDDTDSYTQWTLSCAHVCGRSHRNAGVHIDRALKLNPNDVEALALNGLFLTYIGETDEAMTAYREAENVDPHNLSWLPWYWGFTYFTAGRFNETIDTLEPVEQPHVEMLALLAASYAYDGRSRDASRTLDAFLSAAEDEMVDFPGHSTNAWIRNWNTLKPYKDDAHREAWAVGLRKAGLDP